MDKIKKLRVLHLASFIGNLGDNANHKGIRKMFKNYLEFEMVYDELEIRDFYVSWDKKKFDENFVELVNQYDLLMIGGGNFFDLYIKESITGSTINISQQILEKIKIPILFFGLGCDPYKGITEEIADRFRNFLDTLIRRDKSFISVRNDGSIKNIKNCIGEEYIKYIHHVPDGGFFTEVDNLYHPELTQNSKIIAINIAGDMPNIRFKPGLGEQYLTYEEFIKKFSRILNRLLQEHIEISLVFVPHIYKDLKIISEVLENIKDDYRRTRITVAPYLHGVQSHDYIFDIYRKANLAIGMRFHTNVCSIAFNTPTIPFSTQYFKVRDLYQEIGLEDRIIDISKIGFEIQLKSMIEDTLSKQEEIKERYMGINDNLTQEMEVYCEDLNNWLKKYY